MYRSRILALALFAAAFITRSALCPPAAGQQSPSALSNKQAQGKWVPFSDRRPYTSVDDMLDKDAGASDSAGIEYYSEDLAHMLLPEKVGDDYVHVFANRLARAEQAAREGKGKLVSETEVVNVFDDLMKEINAPLSMRADVKSVHAFRQHALAVPALPALISTSRNGENCLPGEAIYLLRLLLLNDGRIPGGFLEGMATYLRAPEQGRSYALPASRSELSGVPDFLLWQYSSAHSDRQTAKLFNHLAKDLGL